MRKYQSKCYLKCAACGKVTQWQDPYDSGYGYGSKVACSYPCQLALVKKYERFKVESFTRVNVNSKLTEEQHEVIVGLRKEGLSAEKIADEVGTTAQTVYRVCRRYGVPFTGKKVAV